MTIQDTIWLLAHSKEPEDRREWAVLYWKSQGLKHEEIANKFGYSMQWVQRYMTHAYKRFGVPVGLDKYAKLKVLEELVFPEIREFIQGNPDTLKELPPPPLNNPPQEPGDDTKPNKVVVVKPQPMTTRNGQDDRKGRWWIWPLVFVIIAIIGFAAYQIGKNSDHLSPQITPIASPAPVISSPIPTQPVPISAPTATPTALSTDTAVPADTALPTATSFVPPADGILFQDNFDNGIDPSWQQVSGKWITNNGRLSIIFEDFRYVWLLLNHPEWKNYHIQADIDRSAGQIALGIRDRSLYFISGFYGLNCWTMDIQDNADCILGEADRDLNPAKSSLEIDVNGDAYVARLNGTVSQRLTMSGSSSGGVAIGIYCQRGFECPSVDNLKITYLP